MSEIKGKFVVITGASSGIGEATAKLLASRGAHVVMGARRVERLEALKIDEWNRMIDINIRGVLHGIAAGLPLMKEQQSGHFVNVASIGAYAVTPTAAVYCATKYAVRARDGVRAR
ncbi:hypothetical protein J23TS9_15700 [Paenibacillus sp. J23TS9]|nr:hypothetical protein J23TS9_15700 [Paenibacillus sp. J23TS9]